MRYTVTPNHFADVSPRNPVAAFNSLALATQWAKNSAGLEGASWSYDVYDGAKAIAFYYSDGTIETPNGIAIERGE